MSEFESLREQREAILRRQYEEMRHKWEASFIAAIKENRATLEGRRIGFVDTLEAERDRLQQEVEYYHRIKADHCACGHSLIAHLGHGHAVGTPEPTFCSQLDGCHQFNPISLVKQLAERDAEIAYKQEIIQSQAETIRRNFDDYAAQMNERDAEISNYRRTLAQIFRGTDDDMVESFVIGHLGAKGLQDELDKLEEAERKGRQK